VFGPQFVQNHALERIDLALPAGKTSALIGPSGCGKSTILRLVLGLIRPSGGEVRFRGEPVTAENAPALRRRMGYVVQDGGLFPHLTARDNVPGELAVESLRSAPSYVYDERVVVALERVLRERDRISSGR